MTAAGEAHAGPAPGLVAELDRRCIEGLAEAARALAGPDPAPVCHAFRAWKRVEGRRSWPWLPGLCWSALASLGAAFPVEDEDAVTLGRFLIGTETAPARVVDALDAFERRARPRRAAAAGGADLTVELRRRTLETAVERFWQELREVAERLRAPVVEGDRAQADTLVVAARRRLEDTARRVDSHARRLAEALEAPAAAAQPASPAELGRSSKPDAATRQLEPAQPAVDWVSTAPPAAGFSGSGRPDPADVEYRPVREHPLAPLVFLAVVTLLAAIWLLLIVLRG